MRVEDPTFYKKNRRDISKQEILNGIILEDLFGMVEVDIKVPDEWNTCFN